jgi:2-polyprenyl-3-methyl-5-hydroxy-6-metoxy-1,4-benzoquinol methylase
MSAKAATVAHDYAAQVRGQYEDYPYPLRDPAQEGNHFQCCDAYSLMGLSHAGWGGKRDLRKGTRILTAGCGTGDAAIMFAEELLGYDAEIIAIDLSTKSLEIAQARMKKRGLTNVTFKHMSILDAPNAGLGQFDIIESSGVLHHLPDPDAGLTALAHMLKDDGMMAVMVYGQYGRMSIYLVQELMKQLITEDMPRAEKIALARDFLNNVPIGHWLTVNNELFKEDISWPDGSGIYDLFLHSHDRAYTVPQIYDWVEGRGLILHELFHTLVDSSLYTPENYNIAPNMVKIFASKSKRERQTIAELLHGNMSKHSFYASKQPRQNAEFADDMVMCYGPLQEMFAHFAEEFAKIAEQSPVGNRLEGKTIPFAAQPNLVIINTTHTAALMRAIDGKRSIGQIVANVAGETGASMNEVRDNLQQLYREYRSRQVVYLRHESIPPYRGGRDIKTRMEKVLGKTNG